MSRNLFYKKIGPFVLCDIIKDIKTDITVIGDKELTIHGIATLSNACKEDATFFYNHKYIDELKNTKAGVCILKEEHKKYAPKNVTLVITSNPRQLYATFINKFYLKQDKKVGVSKLAFVDPSAKVCDGCCISSGAVIGKNAVIGNNVYVGHNTVIGDNVMIGNNTIIEANSTIVYAIIGQDCLIYSGVKIGQDGFGFLNDGQKIRHVGIVSIGNNVEIGANTCIDKGVLGDTIIEDNCKIDNLVQIGHNVEIGKNTFIVAQVGIAGSTKIGQNVMFGGQTGITGHLKIEDNVVSAAKSLIIRDIKKGQAVGGCPAIKLNDWHRQSIILKKQLNNKL